MNKSQVIWSLVIVCNLVLGAWNLPYLYAQDKIIAVVNKEIITQKDLQDFSNFMRMQLSGQYKGSQLEEKIKSMKKDLLNKLIEDKLVLQEAKNNNIQLEEDRVKARIAEIKAQYPTEADFQNDIAREGLVQADLEARIREQMLMYTVVELKVKSKIVIRPDEVTRLYNNSPKAFLAPEEREIQAVTLESEDLAKTFSYNWKSGQKLEDLATRYPIGLNNLKVTKEEGLRKEIQETVFALNIGEISAPIKVEKKYYVIKLDNVSPSRQLSLAEAQDRIHSLLFNMKMEEEMAKWLDELKAQSYVKITQE